jgi:pimeloyl-[acyl-carrier protein] methyl ester esterase
MSTLPLVLLHGWGAHAGVWGEVIAGMDLGHAVIAPDYPAESGVEASINEILDRLAGLVAEPCVVAGWSLGGQLALQWALRYPRQIRKLVLVATTPKFVAAPDWPHGMDEQDFSRFAGLVATDPVGALQRFLLLQTRGDVQSRAVARRLEAALDSRPPPPGPVLTRTLGWLRDTDLRSVLPGIVQPALVLHGDRDGITPPAAAEFLATQLAGARLERMAGAAHAPFVSEPAAFGRRLAAFCNE